MVNAMVRLGLAGGVLIMLVADLAEAGPTGFRGDGSGLHPGSTLVTKWSDTENVIWKTKMPSWSNASPAPVGDKVFTCAEPNALVCVNAADGAVLWQATNGYGEILSAEEAEQLKTERGHAKTIGGLARHIRDRANKLGDNLAKAKTAEDAAKAIDEISAKLTEVKEKWAPTPLEQKYRNPRTHGGTGYSTATPVSDGKHVWAVFGNGLVACYTVGGERKWIRLVGKPTHGHGHAASPLLVGGKLIVAISSIHALNPETGDEIWKAKSKARFGTPVAVKIGGADAVVTAEGQLISAADGKIAQSGMGGLEYNCPVIGDGMAFFVNSKDIRAFTLPDSLATGAKPKEAWKARGTGDRAYASPVYHAGILYSISDKSSLLALDAKSGEKIAQKSLGIRGSCYTSLAVAGDYLIAGAEGGEIAVLKAGRELEVVSKNKLDKLRSTPAIVGGRLYLRTMGSLYCIGAK